MLRIREAVNNLRAERFCDQFVNGARPKYVYGRSEYGRSIADAVEIDGFIDDFTAETDWVGKPIVPAVDVPDDALVVIAVVICSPLVAEKKARQFQFESLDYYSFFRHAGLDLKPIEFWGGFEADFSENRSKYDWAYGLMSDKASRDQFYNLVNFRLSFDLDYMRGFSVLPQQQYFEEFVGLREEGESFVDIGGFDGFTSEEFRKRCPRCRRIHFFEPDADNLASAKARLGESETVRYYPMGVMDRKETLHFSSQGSSSKVDAGGDVTIHVDRLDALLQEPVTFIKMDIEGVEGQAIDGALETIARDRPRLAISAYHRADDFWQIPEQILSIREDYRVYLRHYTEGFTETVLYFV